MMRPNAVATASDPDAEEPLSLEVCEKAMQWWLDIHSSKVDAQTLSAFNHWRNEHRVHEIAWQRAEALAGQMQAFRQSGNVRLAKSALLSSGTAGVGRRQAIKTLGLILAAGAGAWTARDTAFVQHFSADYSTGVGEQRRIAVANGLDLQLNTRSAINARRVDHHWQLKLLKGEVLIDTSVTPPLLLKTAQLQALATAGQFSARQLDSGTTLLSVYRGALQITPSPSHGAIRLDQGQQASFAGGVMFDQRALEQSSPAWSQGMIVANGQQLPAFLDELARYRYGHLGCDPALASLRVWGTFPLADTERVIAAVADTLTLDVQRFTRLWVNLRRPQRAV